MWESRNTFREWVCTIRRLKTQRGNREKGEMREVWLGLVWFGLDWFVGDVWHAIARSRRTKPNISKINIARCNSRIRFIVKSALQYWAAVLYETPTLTPEFEPDFSLLLYKFLYISLLKLVLGYKLLKLKVNLVAESRLYLKTIGEL